MSLLQITNDFAGNEVIRGHDVPCQGLGGLTHVPNPLTNFASKTVVSIMQMHHAPTVLPAAASAASHVR